MRRAHRWFGGAVLALTLVAPSERAWGQAPAAAGDSLERAAAALVEAHAFDRAAAVIREQLAIDPSNRHARELLAFTLESSGDLHGERHVRSALAREFPDDPGIQTDYGRVLERSGDEVGALRTYRRARALDAGRPNPPLDAAIERMRGRTTVEVGTPLEVTSDPGALASRVRAGAAIPFGSCEHVTLIGSQYKAEARQGSSTTKAEALALSVAQRRTTGAYWTLGVGVHRIWPAGAAGRDVGIGSTLLGRSPIGTMLEADARAEAAAPWDEAATTVLHGGRTTGVEGHLYAHGFSRRLLLQVGARRRELSILAADSATVQRPRAWESVAVAGADLVLWRKPEIAVRGEMLDETLTAPTTISPAVTLAYRHYDVSTRTTPEFNTIIGMVPRGVVDEVSAHATLASPRRNLGLELNAGLARDVARAARGWDGGGALIWAPLPATRLALRYDEAIEVATGLVGMRRAGSLSLHVDL